MTMWKKLIDYPNEFLARGVLLRFAANHPFESLVVMMICDYKFDGKHQFCLIAISGYKAGINCYQVLPEEASPAGTSVSKIWLIENWSRWVWPDGSASEVDARDPLLPREI